MEEEKIMEEENPKTTASSSMKTRSKVMEEENPKTTASMTSSLSIETREKSKVMEENPAAVSTKIKRVTKDQTIKEVKHNNGIYYIFNNKK